MPGQPYMQFYVGDWVRSLEVQSLPFHERGIWFEMLCLMHDAPLRGELSQPDGTPMADDEIARRLGLARQDYTKARDLILRKGVASTNERGAIYCRRMVRERLTSDAKRRAGKAGADSRWGSKALAELWQCSENEACFWKESSEVDRKKIKETLDQWQAYRQQRAEAPKDWSLYWRKQLDFLSRYPIPVAIDIINTAIRNNWQGLFEPKNQKPPLLHRNGTTTTPKPILKVRDE